MSTPGAEINNELSALLDGELSATEQAALEKRIQSDPAARERLAAMLRQEVLLGEILAENKIRDAQVWQPTRKANPFNRLAYVALATAACLLLGIFGYLKVGREVSPVDQALVSALADNASLERDGKVQPLREGFAVLPGDKLQNHLEIKFPDGSLLVSDAGTEWTWRSSQAGHREIELKSGVLTADIAKQPAGSQYVFQTALGSVKIIGTRFKLAAQSSHTELQLLEGKVKVRRHSDRSEIEVAAGNRVKISMGDSLPMAAVPLTPPPVLPQRTKLKALLVTAEPLPFYQHDVAIQKTLIKLGYDVEVVVFDRITPTLAADCELIAVSSHKCNQTQALLSAKVPVIAWHNIWHQDLGLLDKDVTPLNQLKPRSMEWTNSLDVNFAELARNTKQFEWSSYSSLPETRGSVALIRLLDGSNRSPLVLFDKSAGFAGPRVVFSLDIQKGNQTGVHAELGEEIFETTVRWCERQRSAPKP